MRLYNRVPKISSTENVSNDEVLKEMETKSHLDLD